MKSAVIKRSIVIAGHKTSVSLESQFWDGFKAMAVDRNTSISDLAAEIDGARKHGNLSSALRLAVFAHFDKREAA